MIFEEIKDLETYIKKNVGVQVVFGVHDFDPKQYPLINIVPDQEMKLFYLNEMSSDLDVPLKLRIIVDKKHELKAFQVLEKLIKKINQFNKGKGHLARDANETNEDTISTEYTDNTYEISLIFMLKFIVQDK